MKNFEKYERVAKVLYKLDGDQKGYCIAFPTLFYKDKEKRNVIWQCSDCSTIGITGITWVNIFAYVKTSNPDFD